MDLVVSNLASSQSSSLDTMIPTSSLVSLERLLKEQLTQRTQRTPSRQFLRWMFSDIPVEHPRMPTLPFEIREHIIDMVLGRPEPLKKTLPPRPDAPARHPALTPPACGTSFFMQLPTELRRQIFWKNFADRDTNFHPSCGATNLPSDEKRKDPLHKIDKRAHSIPNLMTINSKICGEITEVVYEERTFVIHVHEGLKTGGVEILNAGRQPLQYQDSTEDKHFAKFEDRKDFGFQSMRKIVIQIYPTTEDQNRHLALNTHFMNLALCRLLERLTNEKQRITSISIEFAARQAPATDLTSRAAIFSHEKPWIDSNGPKQSSIHNVSDIELALRPFAVLTGCHFACIKLPSYLTGDPALATFVTKLVESMKSKTGTLEPNDILEHHVENLRPELEAHVVALYYGNGNRQHVAKLTDKEMSYDSGEESDSEAEYEGPHDEAVVFDTHPISTSIHEKHTCDLSLRTSQAKRRKTTDMTGKTKGLESSLLKDPELEAMDDDDQLQQVLRLSMGWSREPDGQAVRRSKRIGAEMAAQLAVVRKNEAMGEYDDGDEDDMSFALTKMVSKGEITEEMYAEIMSTRGPRSGSPCFG